MPQTDDYRPGTHCEIRKGLLRQIFSGTSLHRWNDKLTPCPLAEMDKQGHKMIVAALLLARASRQMAPEEHLLLSERVIEGALFDYLFRTVTTDIKPPIFYKIKEKEEQYTCLADYVLEELDPVLSPIGAFRDRFQAWHRDRNEETVHHRLLKAAHQFASQWEYRIIRPLNTFDPEMRSIGSDFRQRFQALSRHVDGIADILNKKTAIAKFANFCGQLRFQIRWTQIPRVPQTDVLGHMFFTGAMSYLYSLTVGACRARRVNNFFGGLFHDLPELLTRDIISPVKKSSEAMGRLIRECEREELDKRIFKPLNEAGETEFTANLKYYLGLEAGSEFSQRIVKKSEVIVLDSFDELDCKYNSDEFSPLDGKLVKACDTLSAFLEADDSVRNGISSSYLVSARMRLRDQLCDEKRTPSRLRMQSLMADFN